MDAAFARAHADAALAATNGDVPLGFATFDADLRCVDISALLAQALNLTEEDVRGKRIADRFPAYAEVEDVMARVLGDKQPANDLQVRRWTVNLYPLASPEGEALGVLATAVVLPDASGDR